MTTERGPGVEYSDSDILNATKQIPEGNTVQLIIGIPPSGREFTSEKMPNDRLKGSVLIDWCAAVRNQIDADYFANKQEIEDNRQLREDAPIRPTELAQEAGADETMITVDGITVGLSDPEEFIKNAVEQAAKEVAYATEALLAAQERQTKACAWFEKWDRIARSLDITIEADEDEIIEEGDEDDESEKESS